MITVLHVPAFQDNYIWLIRADDRVAIVDPGDAQPVIGVLERERLHPVAILCTHHHHDHVGGVATLLQRYPIAVYGPAHEAIDGVTRRLDDHDQVDLPELDIRFEVLAIPGHTRGHIAYYGHDMLFCGDTLFSAGCGRLFEGTAQQMHASLSRLAVLPDRTRVYCGHEYTAANLRFALSLEPDNCDLRAHTEHVSDLRQRDLPSLPSTIGLERRINPFLRTTAPPLRRAAEAFAGHALDSDTDVFASLRRWKDGFRG